MPNTHDVGDVVRVWGYFTSGSQYIDPDTVSLRVREPDGTVTTYTYSGSVSRSTTGSYYKDLSVTSAGDWHYKFYSTGDGQAAESNYFTAAPSVLDE